MVRDGTVAYMLGGIVVCKRVLDVWSESTSAIESGAGYPQGLDGCPGECDYPGFRFCRSHLTAPICQHPIHLFIDPVPLRSEPIITLKLNTQIGDGTD